MCKGLMHDTVDTKVACEGKEMGELLEILHEEFDKSGAQISVCVCWCVHRPWVNLMCCPSGTV